MDTENIDERKAERHQKWEELRERRMQRWERRSGKSRIFTGLCILAAGAVLLMQRISNPFPEWLFTWPVFLMAAGLFVGIRKGFRGPGWLLAILIGGFFLAGNIHPEWNIQKYTGPVVLIAIGLAFILRPRHHGFREHWHHRRGWMQDDCKKKAWANTTYTEPVNEEEMLDITSVLGGTKKMITSKTFKGGEITNFLGGTELNLSQADIQGQVTLDITNVLGGTKLIVPSHWDIKPELVSVFGSIEDKRQLTGTTDPTKILLLKGSSVFGGVEIKSY